MNTGTHFLPDLLLPAIFVSVVVEGTALGQKPRRLKLVRTQEFPFGTSQTGLFFEYFRLSREFSSGAKKYLPFTPQQEFPGICGKWQTTCFSLFD